MIFPPNNLPVGIVGGGPAGCAAAIMLAQKGIAVEIYEKENWPVDKVCGEGIMPSGKELLGEMKVLSHLSPGEWGDFLGISYHVGNDFCSAKFQSGKAIGISRKVLSQALFDRMKELPLIKIFPHHRFESLDNLNEHVVATFKSNGKEVRRYFSLLVGADGGKSKVRREVTTEKVNSRRFGGRVVLNTPPTSEFVQVHWNNHLEAYVTPTGNCKTQLAFIWDSQKINFKDKHWRSLLKNFPQLACDLSNAEELLPFSKIGPLDVQGSHQIVKRVVLLGDAYQFIDGITGEGLTLAFEQAEALTKSVTPVEINLAKYRELSRAPISRYIILTRFALIFTRFPLIRNFMFLILKNFKIFFEILLEANMGRSHSLLSFRPKL